MVPSIPDSIRSVRTIDGTELAVDSQRGVARTWPRRATHGSGVGAKRLESRGSEPPGDCVQAAWSQEGTCADARHDSQEPERAWCGRTLAPFARRPDEWDRPEITWEDVKADLPNRREGGSRLQSGANDLPRARRVRREMPLPRGRGGGRRGERRRAERSPGHRSALHRATSEAWGLRGVPGTALEGSP